MGLTGTKAAERLASAKSIAAVDAAVLAMVAEGGLAPHIATGHWQWITSAGGGHVLRMLVTPDYVALGTVYDTFRISRASPFAAQRIADRLFAILPTRKILALIEAQASPKWGYIDVKGSPWFVPAGEIESHKAATVADEAADRLFGAAGIMPGARLTIGYRKAIVVGPDLDGSKVAISGGRWPGGVPVQLYYTGHVSSYSDYSHGIVLVSRKANLDGRAVDLVRDVFGSTDPAVHARVSDQGHFSPFFPNAGPAARGGIADIEGGDRSADGGYRLSDVDRSWYLGGGAIGLGLGMALGAGPIALVAAGAAGAVTLGRYGRRIAMVA